MTPLGTFLVTTDPGMVAAFRAATGLSASEEVPATFPMRWLAAPEIRDALLAMAPEADLVPVHESQSFDYSGPLTLGRQYSMEVGGRRDAAPDRLVLAGTIGTEGREPLVCFETILRLFSTATVAA